MSLDFDLYYEEDGNEVDVFEANITHNLGQMAAKANIYSCLWRPDENDFVFGKDVVDDLENGLKELKDKPEYFEQFNSPNGWGLYKNFVPWVEKVLNACKEYPNAKIKVSV